METLVLFMMILVCLSFVLKQTFHNVKEIMAAAVVLLFFVGMMWTFAAEQSKTQVAAWIADQQLMLDMAVLMSVDVALTMFFCVFHVDIKTSEHVSKAKRTAYTVLKYFPGLLVFPVVFSFLVMLVFPSGSVISNSFVGAWRGGILARSNIDIRFELASSRKRHTS